jgi:thiol-disulfide isomerase/thioredoxin
MTHWGFMGSSITIHTLQTLMVCTCLLCCSAHAWASELAEGMPAPAIQLELIGGGAFNSVDQSGKVVVLNFWATWCAPCREEMPAIDAFYRAHRAEGLEVIAVSIDAPRDLDKIRRIVKNYSFATALALGKQASGYGRLSRVPVTFVIDRNGVLRFDGYKFAKLLDQPTLEKIVTPLLHNPRSALLADAKVLTP